VRADETATDVVVVKYGLMRWGQEFCCEVRADEVATEVVVK